MNEMSAAIERLRLAVRTLPGVLAEFSEAESEQRPPRHRPEQVYFILEGAGRMTVGSETQQVGPGDCIFIPPGQPHGLTNDGDTTRRYFSAAASAYEPGHLEKTWALKSEAESV